MISSTAAHLAQWKLQMETRLIMTNKYVSSFTI